MILKGNSIDVVIEFENIVFAENQYNGKYIIDVFQENSSIINITNFQINDVQDSLCG